MARIKHNLKGAQDRNKIYVERKFFFRDFKVGEHVFFKVKAKRSSLRLWSFKKLATRYCGPFEILEKIGPVACMFSLPASMCIHNVFHVSLLKKYVPDANHVIDWNVIQVEHEGDLWVEPVCILDWKDKVLRNKAIWMVNIQWTFYNVEYATWEHEENMRAKYPQILYSFEEKIRQDSILSS